MSCDICPFNCKGAKETPYGLCNVIKLEEKTGLTFLNYGLVEYGLSCPEKLGFFHFYPGHETLYIVTSGCNLKCFLCREYSLVFGNLKRTLKYAKKLLPQDIINLAHKVNATNIIFSCNSILNYEFLMQVIRLAIKENIGVGIITHGVFNTRKIRSIIELADAFLVRFFGFSERSYSRLTILPTGYKYAKIFSEEAYKHHKLLEISYTLVPSINDDPNEISSFLEWISCHFGYNIPIHFRRFYPKYFLSHRTPTRTRELKRAWKEAKERGFRYVYIDDVFEGVERNTYCSEDGELLIMRIGEFIKVMNLEGKKCVRCGKEIPLVGKAKSNYHDTTLRYKFIVDGNTTSNST